jgi:hypothetical protein
LEEGGIRQAPIVGAEPNELNDGNIGWWCHEISLVQVEERRGKEKNKVEMIQ